MDGRRQLELDELMSWFIEEMLEPLWCWFGETLWGVATERSVALWERLLAIAIVLAFGLGVIFAFGWITR